MIDLNLQKEEALKQLELIKDSQKSSDRLNKDTKMTQQEALKKLEHQTEQKDQEIENLKKKMTE